MRVVQLFGREEDTAAPVRGAQPRAPRGPPPLDHDLRRLLPGRRGADRRRDGAAAVVRRAPGARRHAHGRRAGRVHPVHAPVLPAAAGPVREVQPAAERHGLVRAGVRPAGRAGHGARARARRRRCRGRCGARSASRASGSATSQTAPGCSGTSRSPPRRGRRSRWWDTPARARPRSSTCCSGSTIPIAGRITVDGVDIRELSTADLRSIIGFVQQDLFLFTGDIQHNLTLDAPIAPEAARQAARRVGADRFIERLPVGLPPRARASAGGASAWASASC